MVRVEGDDLAHGATEELDELTRAHGGGLDGGLVELAAAAVVEVEHEEVE